MLEETRPASLHDRAGTVTGEYLLLGEMVALLFLMKHIMYYN